MATERKFRRGTSAEHDSFIGANGELTVVTDDYSLRVHDGTTVGGHTVGTGTELEVVARSLNVLNSDVMYATDTVSLLDDKIYIYNASTQVTYSIPELSTTGETITSVDGNELTTSTAEVYSLVLALPSLDKSYHVDRFTDIHAAASYCESNDAWLDLRGAGSITVTETVDFTNVNVISDGSCAIYADPENFDGSYVITWGDHDLGADYGRAVYSQLVGQLVVRSTSRNSTLNGCYRKGSWFNHGHLRAYGFNGAGIHDDSIWDSTMQRTAVELCGNLSTYAYYCVSNGDTNNASNYISLQTEQSYHKAFYINVIRDVFHNIHSERTYVLSDDDGSSLSSGATYMNYRILGSNSSFTQVIIDGSSESEAPDGTTTTSTTIEGRIEGDNCTFSALKVSGNVSISYGNGSTYDGCYLEGVYQKSPSTDLTFDSLEALIVRAEKGVTFNQPQIGTFNPSFNAVNLTVVGGTISEDISFTSNILGGISFNNTTISGSVGDTKVTSGYRETCFTNCQVGEVTGSFNSEVIFSGGYITSVSLSSQSKSKFYYVEIGSFTYSGNQGFLTRGCIVDSVTNWSTPTNVNYPAGTITERIGYNVNGAMYINTDGATTWTVLV